MGSGRKKLAQRFSFLIPKNITRERPVALMLAMIRWWEALRMPEGGEMALQKWYGV